MDLFHTSHLSFADGYQVIEDAELHFPDTADTVHPIVLEKQENSEQFSPPSARAKLARYCSGYTDTVGQHLDITL